MSAPPEQAPKRALHPWLSWVLLPLLVAATAIFKVRDIDVWWRVKTGEWIWTHKSIPDTDPFSYTSDGPWNCVEPLGNLFLYLFDAVGGPAALSMAGALLALGAGFFAALLASRASAPEKPGLAPIFLAVGLFASVANFRFGPKPAMFSMWGLAIVLWLLHSAEQKEDRRLVFWIPLVALVWGFLHRGSTTTIPVLGAATLAWGLRKETRRLALAALGALALSGLALLLTPGMAESLSSSADVVSNDAFTTYIGEWRPLDAKIAWETMPFLYALVGLWLLVAPVQRRIHFGTVVVLGTFVMAATHVRFTPLFAVALVPEVAWGLARLLRVHGDRLAKELRPSVITGLAIAVGLAAMLTSYAKRKPYTWGFGVDRFRRPSHAVQFVADNPPPGQLFNTFNFGSYLIYALGPETKVFIDGRNDQVYRTEFFAEAAVTPGNSAVLAKLVNEYEVSWAILQCTTLETQSYLWLYANPEWQLVYMDDQAAVVVKKSDASASYLAEHGYLELNPANALTRAENPGRDPRAAAFAAEVLRHVQEVPHSIRANHLAALIHKAAGHEAEYLDHRRRIQAIARKRRLDVILP